MNNSMPTFVVTQMKRTNSLKDPNTLFSQEEIADLNRLICAEEIQSIIKNHPKMKAPGPGFIGKFYHTFKDEIASL